MVSVVAWSRWDGSLSLRSVHIRTVCPGQARRTLLLLLFDVLHVSVYADCCVVCLLLASRARRLWYSACSASRVK